MRAAFSLVPPYLRTDGSETGVGGPPWSSEFGFPAGVLTNTSG